MSEYVTRSGDTWDLIAKRTLGSEYYLTDLIDVNPDHRETVIFPAGITLTIPDIEPDMNPLSLPPWVTSG